MLNPSPLYLFQLFQCKVEEHEFWVAKSTVLKGCVGQGETVDDAVMELENNEREWIITAKDYGIPISGQRHDGML